MDTSKKNIVWAVIIAVVALGVGFYGGTAYASSHAPARGGFAAGGAYGGGASGGARTGGRAGGAGVASGTVISADASSITVKLASGSTEIVLTSPSTAVAKSTSGSLSDVTVGANVLITGTPNSDGSLTASSIQLRPAGSVMSGGRVPGGTAPAATAPAAQ